MMDKRLFSIPLLGGMILASSLGCGPGPQKMNENPQSSETAPLPPDAKPIAPGSEFKDGSVRNSEVKRSTVLSQAEDPKRNEEEWIGTVESGLETPTQVRDDRSGVPPMTQGLADRLGGYRLLVKDGECRFHVTGVDVAGPCEVKGDALVLTPKTVGGQKTEEAAKDPAFSSLTTPFAFVKKGSDYLLEFDEGMVIRFKPPQKTGE